MIEWHSKRIVDITPFAPLEAVFGTFHDELTSVHCWIDTTIFEQFDSEDGYNSLLT